MNLNNDFNYLSEKLSVDDLSLLSDSILIGSNLKWVLILREFLKLIFINYFKISKEAHQLDDHNYSFLENYNRDYDYQWNSIRKKYDLMNVIILDFKPYGLNFSFILDFFLFLEKLYYLGRMESFRLKFYLGLKLLQEQQLRGKIKKVMNDKMIHNLVFFYDGSFESKLFAKYRLSQCKTTTFVHGYDNDSNLSSIRRFMNISSDFIICNGDFHYNQLKNNGFRTENLYFTNFKICQKKINYLNTKKTNYIIVFLESPSSKSYFDSKKILLDFVNKFSVDNNYKFIIKLHPLDSIDAIDIKLLSCISVTKNNLDDLLIYYNPEFALIGKSSVYIDLLIREIKTFQINSDNSMTSVVNDLDIVKSYDDLISKIVLWNNYDSVTKNKFFQKSILYYIGDKDDVVNLFYSFRESKKQTI